MKGCRDGVPINPVEINHQIGGKSFLFADTMQMAQGW